MTPEINELSDQERRWIATQIEGAARFVDAFSERDAGQPLTLAALDRAFASWLDTRENDRQLVNSAINCVGVAFGQFLVDGSGLRWVIATDESGSDLAVYGLPGQGDVLVYPANFVAKRWENRETSFLEVSCARISEQVQNLKTDRASTTTQKPWWKFW